MTWNVPRIWEGGECYILGGGPSLTKQFNIPDEIVKRVLNGESPSIYSPYLSRLHDKHVIGINKAYMIGDWMDFIFFGDTNFHLQNKAGLAKYPGQVVTCCSNVIHGQNGYKRLQRDKANTHGISTRKGHVSWNCNSGAAAISLAVHLGVKRIILIGFDMALDNGNQHWHKLYGKTRAERQVQRTFDRHLRGFPRIAKDARKLGVEILNANPDSKIDSFSKVNLMDVCPPEKKVTILCVLKSGGDFNISHVERLKQMVEKNITLPHNFVCLTDFNINPVICESIQLSDNLKGWWSKVELFRKELTKTERNIYFDLDTVITGNLDSMIKIDEDFIGLKIFYGKDKKQLNSSFMSWRNDGSFDFIYSMFGAEHIAQFRGDQDYVAWRILNQKKSFKHWQDLVSGIYSYKTDCKGKGLPEDAKLVCFHGKPRPQDASDEWVKSAIQLPEKAKILIQFPTKGRPKQFMDYLSKYWQLAHNMDRIQMQVSCDYSDTTMNMPERIAKIKSFPNTNVIFNANKTKIQAINQGIPSTGWDILLLASDDMLPEVAGYDEVIRAEYEKHFPDFDGVLHFNDGKKGRELNTLAIVGNRYYNRFGYIYHPSYKSLYCDNEFGDVAEKLGKSVYIDHTIIRHTKNGRVDSLYKRNHTFVTFDRINYENRKALGFDFNKPKKVIAFSLFGLDRKYLRGAIENIKLQPEFYPGWTCRFYVDESVPEGVMSTIRKSPNCEVILCPKDVGEGRIHTGIFWRHAILADPDIEVGIVRDCDSRFTLREKICVAEWLKSGKEFHIMRDHEHHKRRIMGGMYGIRNLTLNQYPELLKKWMDSKPIKMIDQEFLSKHIYPLIKDNVLIHDDRHFYKDETVQRMTITKQEGNFIGAIVEC